MGESHPHSDLPDRVQRLEEAHGFAEHTLDQAVQRLEELSRELAGLARRVSRIERSASEAQAPPAPPPPMDEAL